MAVLYWQGNVSYPAATWGTTSATTTVWPGTFTVTSGPPAPPKKRTAIEWLEEEVERVCAMTRPGLVSA